MDFLEPARITNSLITVSPNGNYVCCAVSFTLIIKSAKTHNEEINFKCAYPIQVAEWSPDSNLIFSSNYKHKLVEIWYIKDIDWRCKIDLGSLGLTKCHWAPDSRHILTTSEFHLRISVWSLISKSIFFVEYPKDCIHGLQFSPDSEYLAVAERRKCKDYISLIEINAWQLVKNFEVATNDLAGLSWSRDSSVLAVWESPLEYKLLIYTINGHCLTSYSAYQWALGIKTIIWSPSSQFLAIGSYDEKIRLLNHISWKVITELSFKMVINECEVVIYKEVEKPLTGYPATLASVHGLPLVQETSYEEEANRPVTLQSVSIDGCKTSNPKLGVSLLEFSSDGRYLAARNDNMPLAVWIWNMPKMSLSSVLLHANSVKDFSWSPIDSRLAICTGGNYIYIWTPLGCITSPVVSCSTFQVNSLKWHPSGTQLILVGKDQYSVCFFANHKSS